MKLIPGGPGFRRFYVGYSASLLGSAMAPIAVAFAVLGSGVGSSGLGLVMATRILPIVVMLLLGGLVADRLGGRRVILATDAARCLVQALLAVALLGRPALWVLLLLVALWGVGEAIFSPALTALIPELTDESGLSDANSLLGVARSAASVAGPALAGVITATAGPSAVIAVDALSYAVSFVALLGVSVPAPTRQNSPSYLAELQEGWSAFRSRSWLWLLSLHGCLFNLLVWAPYLVLGPTVAEQRFGGAKAWGLVMAVYGAGAVVGGLLMLGRQPRRPLLVSTLASLGWALPSAALAVGGSVIWIAAAALVAGMSSTVCTSLWTSTIQRDVPADVVGRISAYGTLGAFAFGPLGLALAGPVASAVGSSAVLGFGAVWQLLAGVAVLAVPAVRNGPAPLRESAAHEREAAPRLA